MDTKEKKFEEDIEYSLLHQGGYVKGNQETYDKYRAIDMPVLISFIQKTQQKMWQRYLNVYGDKAEKQLYDIFQDNVSQNGLIHVLRNGVMDRGMKIMFAYFEPASSLNDDLVEKYNTNILTETRQFSYSKQNHNTIDIVLSLNGIPIVALELKNQLTGQSVDNAKHQYMYDRDPKEFIFNFNNRILVYFCVDLYNVFMTTHLDGDKTRFLPFNQGTNGAGNVGSAGNPENPDGYATSYLWEKVLCRPMLLSLIQRYISREESKSVYILPNGKTATRTSVGLIFPRFHQLDVVEKLVSDTRASEHGKNYLIEHSAGSGKSNSIAWLTYRLASLHDTGNKEMFQSVFVVTDRRVLNRQLQATILGFEHLEGQIVTITDSDNSSKLRDAINDKKRIIITTIHRFPIICQELDSHKGKKFAIIVDEAHSSQSGIAAQKLRSALADTDAALKEMAELEAKTDESIKDSMDELTETLLSQGQHDNEYFYAFTATPKPKTLQTFGVLRPDGTYDAFHHYSMRQAIDEGFILDVLQFYTTVDSSYKIVKSIPENPEVEEEPATRAIKEYHDNHQYVINQQIAIIVEKFREVTLKKINGKAKAMVVSPSRAHAVRYYLAMKEYCDQHGYKDVKPLVAFSGTVTYLGKEYTEPQMNSADGQKITETNLPLYFASDMYNVLIVADKYQTGFDEPKLHTMFVLKQLHGVKAVQTLSRLNRCCPDKIDTYVLDFSNTAESIRDSFKPFYEDTLLGEPVDVNTVYKYLNKLQSYHLWSQADIDALYEVYSKNQDNVSIGKLTSILKPVTDAFNELETETKFDVRFNIRAFIRFYAYMAQIVRTYDRDLFKTYIFCEYLFRVIPKTPHESVDLQNKLSLEYSSFKVQPSGSIVLNPTGKDKTLKGEKGGNKANPNDKRDLLANIIDKINIMYAGNFTEADKVIVETIYDQLQSKKKLLQKQAQSNNAEMFTTSIFPKTFGDVARDCFSKQTEAFTRLFQDKQLYERVMTAMAQAIYYNLQGEETE